jgi:3-hydroxyacyl-[acyl-carrier-protein] dehydratase
MRFSLIDRITSLEAGKSVTAVKNLSLAEEYLSDHFPGFPVMPGVLMLESLVQASAWLMRYTEDFQYSTILLKQARAVRFNTFVKPGQTLSLNATVRERGSSSWDLKGTGTVEGASAVSARLTLEQFNPDSDETQVTKPDQIRSECMRELFAQLWRPPGGRKA